MGNFPESCIKLMNDILQQKRELMDEMLSLTVMQTAAIEKEDLDDLNRLIAEKQRIISSVDKLDEEFLEQFNKLKTDKRLTGLSQLEALDLPGASELKQKTAAILETIGRISEAEKHNSRKSSELLDKYGKEIKKINIGRKANQGYNPMPYTAPSYFLDKKK